MLLELKAIAINLGARTLVPAFDANVGAGEVLALMGPSGCGKSSLLAHLAGLLQPPLHGSGRILIAGHDVSRLATEQRRVGLLFQDDLLFPNLNVRDNLLFALPRGERLQRHAAAETALAQAGLAGFGARMPASLSGGQRARVSLLRALLAAPRVLLLDEPFSRLDAALREQMRSFVWQQLREHRVAGVLVTHDAQDVPAGARCIQLAAQHA